MENDILDALEDLGYSGTLLDDKALGAAVEQGPESTDYTSLVSWLTSDLGAFVGLEEKVSAVTCPEDASNFLLELSGFLREYGCPYSTLTEGPINQRLVEKEHRLQLLDYLATELCAIRLTATNKPQLLSSQPQEIMAESDIALHLKLACVALGFPKPPSNVTSFQLFSRIESKVKELMAKCPPSHLGKPLLNCRLSQKQWDNIMRINSSLCDEYKVRREMLLKRLDVTIQSFKWSDRAKQKEDAIASVYQPLRQVLLTRPKVDVPMILSAREDLLRLEKTSSGTVREKSKCAINRILMGRVPDRGGRPWEAEPPPPEMPAFQKRDAQPQRQGSGRGGGRGGRGGGRVQGGWSGGDQGGSGGNWQKGGGGYNQGGGRGGYNQGGGGGGGYNHGGGGGYNQGGGGGYKQGGSGYNQGGGGYNQAGGGRGHDQGGYQQQNYGQQQAYHQQQGGGYSQDNYRGGGGRGRGGRGGRGRR